MKCVAPTYVVPLSPCTIWLPRLGDAFVSRQGGGSEPPSSIIVLTIPSSRFSCAAMPLVGFGFSGFGA